jgi:hypothetical protein
MLNPSWDASKWHKHQKIEKQILDYKQWLFQTKKLNSFFFPCINSTNLISFLENFPNFFTFKIDQNPGCKPKEREFQFFSHLNKRIHSKMWMTIRWKLKDEISANMFWIFFQNENNICIFKCVVGGWNEMKLEKVKVASWSIRIQIIR